MNNKKRRDSKPLPNKKSAFDGLKIDISKYQGKLFYDIDSSSVLTDEFKIKFKKLIANKNYANETSREANELFLNVVESFLNESESFYENISDQIKNLEISL